MDECAACASVSDGPVMKPLIVVLGATASGKSALAMALAKQLGGEILSCDSMAVYRGMDVGTAKPSALDRALIRHYGIDTHLPSEACTAGGFARLGREAIAEITARGKLPILAGGTGLYLRALLEGLFAASPPDPVLRERLRRRSPASLHRILTRFDRAAAAKIHINDVPKVIRAIEVSVAAGRPMTEQWREGRDPLMGYAMLRLGLDPPRAELYERIDARASAMFDRGLVPETKGLLAEYGRDCRALASLGYLQAAAVVRGEIGDGEARKQAQQGHRNYAKRQMTWFRREPEVRWLRGFGDDPAVQEQAAALVSAFCSGGQRASRGVPGWRR